MSASARFVARVARTSIRAPVTPATSFTHRAATTSIARSFSSSNKLFKPVDEFVNASEIPKTIYEAGKLQRSTIVVGGGEELVAVSEPIKKVVPLTRAVYDQMSPHMQKMTLMGKVIVVTG